MFERALCIALSVALTCAGAELAGASAPATDEPPASSSKSTGEVRLQSGGFIRGEIVQYMPGEYVVIVPTGESEPRRFEWAEVVEVVRDADASGGVPGGVPGGMPGAIPRGVPGGVPTGMADADTPAPTQSAPTPSPSRPALTMEQVTGKHPAVLYRIDGEAVGFGAGVTIHAIAYSEICRVPCSGVLEHPGGELFVAGQGYGPSKRFRLDGASSGYTLRVTPRPKALTWLGYVVMLGFISGGVVLAATPVFVDMPKTAAPGYYAGGAIIGALGIAGGITMLAFGRSKVEVLPGHPR
jgi:hypothetical protein